MIKCPTLGNNKNKDLDQKSLCLTGFYFVSFFFEHPVSPVPKFGDPHLPANWRPIVLNCVVTKILEWVLNNHIMTLTPLWWIPWTRGRSPQRSWQTRSVPSMSYKLTSWWPTWRSSGSLIDLTLCTFLKWALYAHRAIMARHKKFTLLSLLVDSNACGHLLWYQTYCILSNKAPERPWYGHQRPKSRVKFKNIFQCRAIMARRA